MVGRLGEEQSVERVRDPVGGTYPVRQTGVEWTRSGSSVEGAQNSTRVAGARSCPEQDGKLAGRTGCTLKRAQLHERCREASAERQVGRSENRIVRHIVKREWQVQIGIV
jgi:hypothetical protein